MQHGLGGFVVTGWGWPLLAVLSAVVVSFAALPFVAALCSIVLAVVMAAIAVEDARAFRIPDMLSLPMIPAGLAVAALLAASDDRGAAVLTHLLGAALGAGLLMAVRVGYRAMRGRDGLGLGDVKLAAAAGAWIGPVHLPTMLLLACVLAFAGIALNAVRGEDGGRIVATTAIPFGLCLAPATWITWFLLVAGTPG